MQLNPLALVALAIFDEQPRHAYDVYATMRHRREDELVKLSAGTLYHTVNRMAAGGLLEAAGTDRDGNRPERTVYRITAAGREALATRIRELIREPVREFPQFPVGVAEIHKLPADEAVALLQDRIASREATLMQLDAIGANLDCRALPKRFLLDLDFNRAMLRCELDWCQQTAEAITSGELDWITPAPAHLQKESVR